MIRGGEVHISPDFEKCLSDRDNKEWMFELVEQVWIEDVAYNLIIVLYISPEEANA